jgi:glutathione synthase/RimK-type ligase-like ATP-grasp enzyme
MIRMPPGIPAHEHSQAASTLTRRVALATCREFANLDPDDAPLIEVLARYRVAAVPAVWDDPGVDWSAFDLVVLRSTWDYPRKFDAFLAWIDSLPRLRNPVSVMRWSADKHYLLDLASAGLPVVPTTIVAPGDAFVPPAAPFVLKPVVGAGSKDAARFDAGQDDAAANHVRRLHRGGMAVIVQPYLARVDEAGEIDMVFLGGKFSHAVRKGAMLGNVRRKEGALFFEEDIRPHDATPDERAVAEGALNAIPGGAGQLLYGRVDLLPTDQGKPMITEVELMEPSLFFGHCPGSRERYSELVARAAGSGGAS